MNSLYLNIILSSIVFSFVVCDSSTEPPTNKYELKFKDGMNYCLLFQSAIRLKFKYALASNDSLFVSNSTDLPKADPRKVEGNCDNNLTNHLNLTFFDDWNLIFEFTMNSTSSKYTLARIVLTFKLKNGELPFPDAKTTNKAEVMLQVNDEWCDKYGSYVCTGRRSYLPTNSTISAPFVAMEMFNEQYNAFINTTKPEFTANVRRCSGDSISNLIPIVVGAALGGLIVIVLIAYIIGRHRSKKGYESV